MNTGTKFVQDADNRCMNDNREERSNCPASRTGRVRVDKVIKQRARQLRRAATEAEKKLWYRLRCQQMGYRFRRQQPLGRYIVDFVCFDRRLVIELDGGHHGDPEQLVYDQARTQWLEGRGFRVLRFWNGDVFQELEGVLETIAEELKKPPWSGSPPGR